VFRCAREYAQQIRGFSADCGLKQARELLLFLGFFVLRSFIAEMSVCAGDTSKL